MAMAWPVAPQPQCMQWGWAEAAPAVQCWCFVSFTSRATRRVKSPYCACSEHGWAAGLMLCAAPHQSTTECVTGTPHHTARVNTCCFEKIYTIYTVEEEKIRKWVEVEKQEKR